MLRLLMHFSDTFDTSVAIAIADAVALCVPVAAAFGFTVGTVVAADAVVGVAPAAVVGAAAACCRCCCSSCSCCCRWRCTFIRYSSLDLDATLTFRKNLS